MIKYSLYEVGGRVRDKFLGLPSNDVDYSVVIENNAAWGEDPDINIVFSLFVKQLELEGYRIYLVTPDCFTIRAKFPTNHVHSGLDADFVLARKEHGYIRGTRKPKVSLGTLIDDLIRRDFTVNAMAEDVLGNILDPFGGQQDLLDKILRTPTDAAISFNDDPLRILRAFRFSITKGFGLSLSITDAIKLFDADKMDVVSTDRVRYELEKMFKHDTRLTLAWLNWLASANQALLNTILRDDLWFIPTTRS